MIAKEAKIHETAIIGENTIVEEYTIIGEGVIIGKNCKIHRHIFIDDGVIIGNCVKIQDNVMIPHGVKLEDGVFVGPSVAFTNDLYPRSINKDGTIKSNEDWIVGETIIGYGASLGANSTIVCGVKIGEWAMIGAGAVVTKDIPPHCLAVGNPARVIKVIEE